MKYPSEVPVPQTGSKQLIGYTPDKQIDMGRKKRGTSAQKVSYWKEISTIRQIVFFPTGNFSLLSVKFFGLIGRKKQSRLRYDYSDIRKSRTDIVQKRGNFVAY